MTYQQYEMYKLHRLPLCCIISSWWKMKTQAPTWLLRQCGEMEMLYEQGKRSKSILTHRHVGACAHKGVGHGVDELSAHTKVTQLDLTAGIHKDVGRLDIWKRGMQYLADTVGNVFMVEQHASSTLETFFHITHLHNSATISSLYVWAGIYYKAKLNTQSLELFRTNGVIPTAML